MPNSKKATGAIVTIERWFGILKARWRCHLKGLDSKIENASNLIMTCVVLHNMCQLNGDEYLDEDEVLKQVLRQGKEEGGKITQILPLVQI